LDNDEAWQAGAFAIEEVLVNTARVDADALFKQVIVLIAVFAFSAEPIDRVKARGTVTISGDTIVDLVDSAAIAFRLVAVFYSYWWSTANTVLCVGEDC